MTGFRFQWGGVPRPGECHEGTAAGIYVLLRQKFKRCGELVLTRINLLVIDVIIAFTPKYAKPNFEFHADRLTRLDDSESKYIISVLNDERTVLINRYSQYDARYLDGTMVYAITHENIFFQDILSGEGYFCVPKKLDERLESLHIDDNAGLAMIGDTPYIRFEMFNLNYNISDSGQLQKSGISKVENIF